MSVPEWRPSSARARSRPPPSEITPIDAVGSSIFTFVPAHLAPRNRAPSSPRTTTCTAGASTEEEVNAYELEMSNPIIARYRRTTPRTREGDNRDKLLTSKLPAAPQPTSARFSMPGRPGQPIHASDELVKASAKFDEGHRARTRASYNGLTKLWRDGGEEGPLYTQHFFKELDKIKYNRIHDTVRDKEKQRSNVLVPHDFQPYVPKKTPDSTFKIESTKNAWRLEDSIWKMRVKWADSRSFYDTPACYERAFSFDWSRALRAHKLAAYIMKNDAEGDSDDEDEVADEHGNKLESGGGADDSELIEVGNVLWKHHQLIYRCFDAYASGDSKNNIDSITYNSFKDFVDDCDLDDSGSKHCDAADFDRLFIQINIKEQEGGGNRRGEAAAVELTKENVGKHGMAVKTLKADEDKRALCRYEWFNVLVRIAIMKYVLPGQIVDVSAALDHMLTTDISPNVDDWIKMDHQIFRREVCYTEIADSVLVEHESSLNVIYSFSADSEGAQIGKEKLRKVVSLKEWLNLVKDLTLLDDSFTVRDATLVFVLSRMRVIDEKGKDAELKLQNLCIDDFYEALLRVACLKALPTDAEIEEVHACTQAYQREGHCCSVKSPTLDASIRVP